jgi:hypothetical protein
MKRRVFSIRGQALREGRLVDITKEARKQGFLVPVAINAKVRKMLNHLPQHGARELLILLDTAQDALSEAVKLRDPGKEEPSQVPFTLGLIGERGVWCYFHLIIFPTPDGEELALTIDVAGVDIDE